MYLTPSIERNPLMMPCVTVPLRPKGLPAAITCSPNRGLDGFIRRAFVGFNGTRKVVMLVCESNAPFGTLDSAVLLSPVPLPAKKPSNRGRFSEDRQYWKSFTNDDICNGKAARALSKLQLRRVSPT